MFCVSKTPLELLQLGVLVGADLLQHTGLLLALLHFILHGEPPTLAAERPQALDPELDAIVAAFDARNDTQMADLARELKTRVDDNCDLGVPSQYYWSAAGSLYFVATVVTTIGYGSFAPQTSAGKALTCYIAIVGIAWFAFILSILGDHLLAFVAWVAVL